MKEYRMTSSDSLYGLVSAINTDVPNGWELYAIINETQAVLVRETTRKLRNP